MRSVVVKRCPSFVEINNLFTFGCLKRFSVVMATGFVKAFIDSGDQATTLFSMNSLNFSLYREAVFSGTIDDDGNSFSYHWSFLLYEDVMALTNL